MVSVAEEGICILFQFRPSYFTTWRSHHSPDALFTDTLCIPCIADHLFTSSLYTSHNNFSIFHLNLFQCGFNTINSMSRLVFLLPTCIFYKIIVVLVTYSCIHSLSLPLYLSPSQYTKWAVTRTYSMYTNTHNRCPLCLS